MKALVERSTFYVFLSRLLQLNSTILVAKDGSVKSHSLVFVVNNHGLTQDNVNFIFLSTLAFDT